MTGPVETEDPRLSRLEEEVTRLRLAHDAEQGALHRLPPPPAAQRPLWASELERQQEEARLARLRAREAEARELERRAQANAPKIAELEKTRDALQVHLEESRQMACRLEQQIQQQHSALLAVRNRIGRLQTGEEG